MPRPSQKEIYWTDLNPVKGSEQSGKRPVVVISGDSMNHNLSVSIVCPLSTKVKNFTTCVVLEPNQKNNLDESSEVIGFQVRSISHDRLGVKIGEITDQELDQIIKGINEVLEY